MGIVSLLYPSNQASETNENNRTSGNRTAHFPVSLYFIALSQQILVSSPGIFNHLVGKGTSHSDPPEWTGIGE